MLRTLIISFLILGCFASFAQNEWGNTLRFSMEALLGGLFLFDFFASMKKSGFKLKGLAGFLNQWERIAFVLLCMGDVFKYNHWMFASVAVVLSAFFMVISQLTRIASTPFQRDMQVVTRTELTLMASAVLCGSAGLTFKIQHWPAANVILLLCLLFSLLFAAYAIGLRILKRKTDAIPILQRWSSNGRFFFYFYCVWALFITWNNFGVSIGVKPPSFHASTWPNAAYKFWDSNDHETADRGNRIAEIAERDLFPAIEKAENAWYQAEPSSESTSSQP